MKSSTSTQTAKILPPLLDENLNDDRFLAELDIAFDEIQMSPRARSRSAGKMKSQTALVSMQKTFLKMAQLHLCPVSRYLKAIKQGITAKDMCDVVSLVIEPFIGQTKKVGLHDHAKALEFFAKVLDSARRNTKIKLTPEQTSAIVKSFAVVNQHFRLSFRGHSTAVLNVLAFYQTLKRNKKIEQADFRRLFAIGIPSMTMLRKSSVAELVSLTGISQSKVVIIRRLARSFTLFELI